MHRNALFCLTALVGCAAPPAPILPTPTLPSAWQQPQVAAAQAPDLRHWWQVLGDPLLDQLVAQALAQNLDLAQARSRLRQARLLAGHGKAQYLPVLTASGRTLQDVSATDSYFQASLDASWELGLFGARESSQQAGLARLDAAASNAQAVQVSTVAEVVRSYTDLRAAQQQQAWLSALAELDAQTLALLQTQGRLRLGAPEALAQARAQWQQSLAQAQQPQIQATQAALGLALLLGQAQPDPSWLQAPVPANSRMSTALPVLRLVQVPADLLRVRPEIRTAEAAVLLAAAELGNAQAALYPRLVIGVSLLYSLNLTQNRRRSNTDNNLPTIGPLLDIPLFDWGRRRAWADAQQEVLDAALLAYRQAVLSAATETEAALTRLHQSQQQAEHLQAAQSALAGRVQTHATLTQLGLGKPLAQLQAQRAATQAAAALSSAHGHQRLALVAVYKALGGAPLLSEAQLATRPATNTPAPAPTPTPTPSAAAEEGRAP